MRENQFLPALLLAAGVALAGWWVGHGFVEGRRADRFVTVKGLSERDVQADLALWPIQFVSTDDDLDAAQAQIRASEAKIRAFLAEQGIEAAQVSVGELSVNDLLTNPYRGGGAIESRYIISQTLMVRSEEPEVVATAAQAVGDLVAEGVILSSQMGPGGPTFLFRGLSTLKPEMIAEATADARAAAEQFAIDSGSRLGGIRQASQGVFSILARDRASGIREEGSMFKTVRVVSTIDYYLED